ADDVIDRPGLERGPGDGEHHQPASPGDQAKDQAEGPVDLAQLDDQPIALARSGDGAGGHAGLGGAWPLATCGSGGAAPSPPSSGDSGGIGAGCSILARISGSFSNATRITSRARGAPAVPPPNPPCWTITDRA